MNIKYILRNKESGSYESIIPWESASDIFDDAVLYNSLEEAIVAQNKAGAKYWEICVITISVMKSSDVKYNEDGKAERK